MLGDPRRSLLTALLGKGILLSLVKFSLSYQVFSNWVHSHSLQLHSRKNNLEMQVLCVHLRSPPCVCVLNCVRLFLTPWTTCSLRGSSAHGIFQEWVAISFSREYSQPMIDINCENICTYANPIGIESEEWIDREYRPISSISYFQVCFCLLQRNHKE